MCSPAEEQRTRNPVIGGLQRHQRLKGSLDLSHPWSSPSSSSSSSSSLLLLLLHGYINTYILHGILAFVNTTRHSTAHNSDHSITARPRYYRKQTIQAIVQLSQPTYTQSSLIFMIFINKTEVCSSFCYSLFLFLRCYISFICLSYVHVFLDLDSLSFR